MKKEAYSFQNFYIITTFGCNFKCPFCLFRFNKIKDCSISKMEKRFDYVANECRKNGGKKLFIKITGGEPFLKIKLLESLANKINEHRDIIYKVGYGTNGSIEIPKFFNSIMVPVDIYVSRHSTPFIQNSIVKNINGNLNIKVKTNCNLIKGQIDSSSKIEAYVKEAIYFGVIAGVCFRELSKINMSQSSIYPKEVYDYDKYYKNSIVNSSKLIKNLSRGFEKTKNTGNYYDDNVWFFYNKKFSVKFRKIDEKRLLDYNTQNSGVDEYVLHPDGLLSGCWDRDLKIILK